FADLDSMPAPILALIIEALAEMSRHPEIMRVRQAGYEALRPVTGMHLLDAGCGGGEVARWLASAAGPEGSVTAVDYSAATIEAARSRHDGSNVEYVRGDVAKLDLGTDSVDGVWSERVLQHVAEPDRVIGELIRVTRPGGRICLIDTDWCSLAYDGMPPGLTDTVRDHMLEQFSAGQLDMGRTLRGRLVRAGLAEVQAQPVTLYFDTPASAAVVLPVVNPTVPVETGMWPDGDIREAWLSEVAGAGDRGDFLAVLTIWVVAGTVL
ncbi:methyltransferase domain-containing protein, partial [Actinoplanes sp. NPDC051633]|uniref:methyltransferase domain-containing protein n=1 Tax=Actinoplanes sp. NPDC051633 TaxID=3155670 RepID=UPI003446226E